MKLRTSQILAQLSEQERQQVETHLAELNRIKRELEQQQQKSVIRIRHLNQQRDQAMRSRNAAALLSVFDVSVREQQSAISQIHQQLGEIEACKQRLMQEWFLAHRNERKFHLLHKKQARAERRHAEQQEQRQIDDLSATRLSPASA